MPSVASQQLSACPVLNPFNGSNHFLRGFGLPSEYARQSIHWFLSLPRIEIPVRSNSIPQRGFHEVFSSSAFPSDAHRHERICVHSRIRLQGFLQAVKPANKRLSPQICESSLHRPLDDLCRARLAWLLRQTCTLEVCVALRSLPPLGEPSRGFPRKLPACCFTVLGLRLRAVFNTRVNSRAFLPPSKLKPSCCCAAIQSSAPLGFILSKVLCHFAGVAPPSPFGGPQSRSSHALDVALRLQQQRLHSRVLLAKRLAFPEYLRGCRPS